MAAATTMDMHCQFMEQRRSVSSSVLSKSMWAIGLGNWKSHHCIVYDYRVHAKCERSNLGCSDGNAYLDLTDYANQSVNSEDAASPDSTIVDQHELLFCSTRIGSHTGGQWREKARKRTSALGAFWCVESVVCALARATQLFMDL